MSKCLNPDCKCGGACKVCNCKINKYNIVGEMWDVLPSDMKEEVVTLIDNYIEATGEEELKNSKFTFGKNEGVGVNGMICIPNLILSVEDKGLRINTGITLERLSDVLNK